MTESLPNRGHNREEDSPEALRQSIEALAQAIAKLDQKLDNATLNLHSDIADARDTTRRLAVEVGNMGEALVRRFETEGSRSESKKKRLKRFPLIAIIFVLGLLLATASTLMLWKQ